MRCTQEYPLFGGRHLCTGLRVTFTLQSHSQTVQFHTELSVNHNQQFSDAILLQSTHSDAYRKCSYFHTPSSCASGIFNIKSILDGSRRIICCIYCCTASVLSISSNGSSGHRLKSCCNNNHTILSKFYFHSIIVLQCLWVMHNYCLQRATTDIHSFLHL